jgi:hypothetical protein
MPITSRTRKILWIKAGGRCSICREQLATDAREEDDPSVFGEECHIVAQSPGGPRASEIAEPDGYENLILLCRKHHKQVDDQRSHFTIELLRKLKSEHEKREARREQDRPVRLIPDPTRPAPKVLRLCLTGEALWEEFDGAMSFQPSYPDRLSPEEAEAVDTLLDDLMDWMDVAGELSYRERRQASEALGEHVRRLAELGMFVGARTRHLLLTGGVSDDSSSWRSVDVQVQRVSEAALADINGAPLTPVDSTDENDVHQK